MITEAIFYLFACVLVFAATMVIASKNPVHSVLFLILSFFSAAGIFLLAGAEFVAMILVVVYVGAVAVLFLFVVMMLDVDGRVLRAQFNRYLPIGLAVGAILLAQMIMIGGAWIVDPQAFHEGIGSVPMPTGAGSTNTQALGLILYTRYFYAFQLAGVILLIAMIGAIVLTLRDRGDRRRQNHNVQLARTKAESVSIRQVETGKGVIL